jgi:P27 family predicted phage terminase small subunit
MVSDAERGVLLALCQQWSRYLDAHDRIRLEGMLVTSEKTGEPKRNPYISIADHALTQCLRLWAELGLTPSSRSRIVALPDAEPTSKWRGLA